MNIQNINVVPKTDIKFSRPRVKRLASTLSGLLEQAIEDAIALENTKGFSLDMGDWCFVDRGDRASDRDPECTVCLAGSSMVRRLGQFEMLGTSRNDVLKLECIDLLRCGNIQSALENISSTDDYKGPKLQDPCNCECSLACNACKNSTEKRELLYKKIEMLNNLFDKISQGPDRVIYNQHSRISWGSYMVFAALMREIGL